MTSFKDAFPSKFMKHPDVETSPIGTIATVDLESVGMGANAETKLVVRFAEPGLNKAFILNRINCDAIAEITKTDDYTKWPGHKIQLVAARTEFQGKRVPCVRVAAPLTKAASRASPQTADVTEGLDPKALVF